MKRTLLSFVFLAGMLTASTAAVYAQTLHGVITSIDSDKNELSIAQPGSNGTQTDVTVSVSDFIRTNGSSELKRLDVGQQISMTVEKEGAQGEWSMTALEKPAILEVAPPKEGEFLEEAKPVDGNQPVPAAKDLKFKK